MGERGNQGGGGYSGIGILILILGILCVGGSLFSPGGIIKLVMRLAGIAAILIGVLVALILAGVIAAASYSSKKDPAKRPDADARRAILDLEQNLANAKTQVRRTELELSQEEKKIADFELKIGQCEKDAQRALVDGNEATARVHLDEKQHYLRQIESAKNRMELINTSLKTMHESIDQLEMQLKDVRAKQDLSSARMTQAKIQGYGPDVDEELESLKKKTGERR